VRWGDCPNCKHRVPVAFPDVRARTQAIQVLLDQGYGRPPQTVAITGEDPVAKARHRLQAMTPEEREELLFQVRVRLGAATLEDMDRLHAVLDERRRQIESESKQVAAGGRPALPATAE
jgi:hypothetical protein